MSHRLQLRWPELQLAIEMDVLEDHNPSLAATLLDSLPLVSIQSHAIVAGKQIYFPTRISPLDQEVASTERMDQQPAGRVNFEPFFQYISLNYGTISESVPAFPIGQVIETDLDVLSSVGGRVLTNLLYENSYIHVILERTGAETPLPESIEVEPASGRSDLDSSWTGLMRHLEREIERIWLAEPEDVRALRSGILADDAGVGDQYFSPWVMVSGLVRSLAVIDLASLVRLCGDEDFGLRHLKKILQEILRLPLGVMSYFGLPLLGDTLGAVQRAAPEIETRPEFDRLLNTLLIYVNRYNLWLHQTFPWRLGVLYPKFDPEEARSSLELLSSPSYSSQD